MASHRQKNLPSVQKDTRKITPAGRETLRRKAITMYKRSCSVAMISAKLGIRKATIYRWIKLYKTHGFKMYKEGKRGRPLLNYYVPERQQR
ncbi:helix-turn-helix domain-containing protein [Akkermansia glycaniphila]|uniref:helix-turn-helix domain-containing protein n=1 Tax=Akkermansia glycaniphila TaxID=1679444 RepID=UPI0009F3ED3E